MTYKLEAVGGWEKALKDFLLFFILGALNVDGMPRRVAGINLKSETANLKTIKKKARAFDNTAKWLHIFQVAFLQTFNYVRWLNDFITLVMASFVVAVTCSQQQLIHIVLQQSEGVSLQFFEDWVSSLS